MPSSMHHYDENGNLICLDAHKSECRGEVDYRYPLSGTGKSFPRCDRHWEERLDKQEEINSKYGGDVPPADFDPAYAGERWDDEY